MAADKIDWNNISFQYRDTNGYMKYTWTLENGWDQGSFETDPYLKVHMCSTGLNYGQQCFEGLKAFKDKQGRVRIFRPQENAARMRRSGPIAHMPEVPEEIFLEGCKRTCEKNIDFVPPVESDGAFYLRPLLFGSGPMIGMNAAPEFTFVVFGMPVGSYYKGGITPAKAIIMETIDRAAPKGTGSAKLGGNYAPTFAPMLKKMAEGYTLTLHLDAKTRSYVDEFSTSNFVALTPPDANGVRTFVTPNSESILRSVTRLTLEDICTKFGWKVEERPVAWSEIVEGKFNEVAACGTAVVLTPVKSITRGDQVITIGDQEKIGEGFQKLYDYYRGIQKSEIEDSFGWMWPAEGLA